MSISISIQASVHIVQKRNKKWTIGLKEQETCQMCNSLGNYFMEVTKLPQKSAKHNGMKQIFNLIFRLIVAFLINLFWDWLDLGFGTGIAQFLYPAMILYKPIVKVSIASPKLYLLISHLVILLKYILFPMSKHSTNFSWISLSATLLLVITDP